MKEEALKLADELDLIAGMLAIGDRIKWGKDSELMENGSAMIRRLVEELDATEKAYKWTEIARNAPTKPLSDEEILKLQWMVNYASADELVDFARAIEERHGIK